jgi:hypothetical protein
MTLAGRGYKYLYPARAENGGTIGRAGPNLPPAAVSKTEFRARSHSARADSTRPPSEKVGGRVSGYSRASSIRAMSRSLLSVVTFVAPGGSRSRK